MNQRSAIPPVISPLDVTAALPARAVERGAGYWRGGRVLSLSWASTADGFIEVTARVRGSAFAPYDVSVEVELDPDGTALALAGECSCPVGFDCKHVAAVLFALAEGSATPPPNGRSRPAGPSSAASPQSGRSRAAVAGRQLPLSPALSNWLDRVGREEEDAEEYPPEVRDRLVYVLDVRDFGGTPRLVASTLVTRLLKDGSFSRSTRFYNPANVFQGAPARCIRSSDREILRRLAARSRAYDWSADGLAGDEGATILDAILATGRARWQSVDGPALERGEPKPARPRWMLGDDAVQRLRFIVEGSEELPVVSLAPPWYIDEACGVLGPVETGLSPRLAEALAAGPPVPAGEEGELRSALASRLPALASYGPPILPPAERVVGPPAPRLTLTVGQPATGQWYPRQQQPEPLARLSFRYGPVEVGHRDGRPRPTVGHDGRVLEIERDETAERRAERRLEPFGLRPARAGYAGAGYLHPAVREDELRMTREGEAPWFEFLARGAPALRAEGWEVALEPDFPVRLAVASGPIEARLEEGSGIDWLELDLGVDVDGERIDLTAPLVELIRSPRFAELDEEPAEAEVSYLRLPDGRMLALPARRLWRMATALRELFGAELGAQDGPLRLSPAGAAELAFAEEVTGADEVAWLGGERLRALGTQLREAGRVPEVAPPAEFGATLRPYQARGVDWLQLLRSAGLGGILADEMGLGKTVQTLAHLAIERASGRMDRPSLIVAPKSVATLWRDEAGRFAPVLRVLLLTGGERHERFDEIAAHDVVITTYPLLLRDREVLCEREWHVVVLDEAHTIKNPNAAVARAAHALRARQRLCLTGTPVENHLGDLWSLCAFAIPGLLPERRLFQQAWRRPIERDGDRDCERRLARRLRPFLLRRTKAEVAQELPPRTEMVEAVEMAPTQRDLYESVRLAMHERVRRAIAERGLDRSHIVILDALLKLRQVCCDPRLLRLESAKAARARSAKLERLLEMLPELVEDGRRILLFSQFTSMLALIEEALGREGLPYVRLAGDTRDRETPVRAFQGGEVPLFLISLKAGGVGLNLTAADTVIHYDPWWNPAVEEQATGRAHRIGQERPIFVSRLITRGSIEEKMEGLKERKREIARGIFEPDASSTLDLTEHDVEELFARA